MTTHIIFNQICFVEEKKDTTFSFFIANIRRILFT